MPSRIGAAKKARSVGRASKASSTISRRSQPARFRQPLPMPVNNKHWPESFGFSIGGDAPSYITLVKKGSHAQMAGLQGGDQLVELHNHNVTQMSAEGIKALARQCPNVPPSIVVVSCVRQCDVVRDRNGRYGMTLIGGGPVYVEIVENNSPAFYAGLKTGDMVLEINGTLIKHSDDAKIFVSGGWKLNIKIIPGAGHQSVRQLALRFEGMMGVDRRTRTEGFFKKMDAVFIDEPSKKEALIALLKQYARDKKVDNFGRALAALLDSSNQKQILDDVRVFVPPAQRDRFDLFFSKEAQYVGRSKTVSIDRTGGSFGFMLVGHSPVMIESIDPGGPADRAGLRPGDKIIKVNGLDVRKKTHLHLIQFLKGSGMSPTLQIETGSPSNLPSPSQNQEALYVSSTMSMMSGMSVTSQVSSATGWLSESLHSKATIEDIEELRAGGISRPDFFTSGRTFKEMMDHHLTSREKQLIKKALQEYYRSRNLDGMILSIFPILDTHAKKTIWPYIIQILPDEQQEVCKKKVIYLIDRHAAEAVYGNPNRLFLTNAHPDDNESQIKYSRSPFSRGARYDVAPSQGDVIFHKKEEDEFFQVAQAAFILNNSKSDRRVSRRSIDYKSDDNDSHATISEVEDGAMLLSSRKTDRSYDLSIPPSEAQFSPLHETRVQSNTSSRSVSPNGTLVNENDDDDDDFTSPEPEVFIPGIHSPSPLSFDSDMFEPPESTSIETTNTSNSQISPQEDYGDDDPVLTPPSGGSSRLYTRKTAHATYTTINDMYPPERRIKKRHGSYTVNRPDANSDNEGSYSLNHSRDFQQFRSHNTNSNNSVSRNKRNRTETDFSKYRKYNTSPQSVDERLDSLIKPDTTSPPRTTINGEYSVNPAMAAAMMNAATNHQNGDIQTNFVETFNNNQDDDDVYVRKKAPVKAPVKAPIPVPPPPPFIPPPPPVPPPPPPTITNGVSTLTVPGMSVKRMNWEKLNHTENTVWSQMREGEDESYLKDVIKHLELDEKFSTISKARAPRRTGSKVETVINHKKAHNLAILLGHLRMPVNDIKQALIATDTSKFSVAHLQQMKLYAPDESEINQLKGYIGKMSLLSTPDKFALEMSRIGGIENRLDGMLFKANFAERTDELRDCLQLILTASNELRSSRKLAKVLELTLAMGNYMNQGNQRVAGATGFRIKFLSELDTTKTSDNKSTFLHILAKAVETNVPRMVTFGEEIPHTPKAAKISLTNLGDELNEIKTKLQEISENLDDSVDDSNSQDKFKEVMSQFSSEASDTLKQLSATFNKASEEFHKTSQYFGEDPSATDTDQFFGIFASFTTKFAKAHIDNSSGKHQ
ncbi:delphilin-like isoform X3 [Antedon mediterranea]|uniref:delphilin-like isoform X3 n=1 Tax=Antedon mediterranea TaxID=105859 RepID=UPI003AF4A887